MRAGERSTKDQGQRRYERAHAGVQAIKGFYIHAIAFVMVNVALIALNALKQKLGKDHRESPYGIQT